MNNEIGNVVSIDQIYNTLIEDLKFCFFELTDNHIKYQVLDGPFKKISKVSSGNTFMVSTENHNYYFVDAHAVINYIKYEFIRAIKDMNELCEQQFKFSANSFDFSNKVANPNEVLFSNIIELDHAKNNWFKKILGLNEYFSILLTVMRVDNTFQYCVGTYADGLNVVLFSTNKRYELLSLTVQVLQMHFNFPVKQQSHYYP